MPTVVVSVLLTHPSDTSFGQKDKEDLDEVSNELELADEDDLIPYLALFLP